MARHTDALDLLINNAGIYSTGGSEDPADARGPIVTALLDPGWVSTDMGGAEAPVTPARSVAAMMRVIDGLNARDNRRFLDRHAVAVPW